MGPLVITLDIDWASECAIEQTLQFFLERELPITVFSTHQSAVLESVFDRINIGLHPFFGAESSHGATINEVVATVTDLPHNILAFRCHRFEVGNQSLQAMVEAGMKLCSNVCTDLEVIAPFRHRSGLMEFPVFLEDGGYLWQQHPLVMTPAFRHQLADSQPKMLLIHPMHFVINTPEFSYMTDIKQRLSQPQWRNLTAQQLKELAYSGYGIRNFIIDIVEHCSTVIDLVQWYEQEQAQRSGHGLSPQWQNQIPTLQGTAQSRF